MSNWFKNIPCPNCKRVLRYSPNTARTPVTCVGCKAVFVPDDHANGLESVLPVPHSHPYNEDLDGEVDSDRSEESAAAKGNTVPRWARTPPKVHLVDPTSLLGNHPGEMTNTSWAIGEAQPVESVGNPEFSDTVMLDRESVRRGRKMFVLCGSALALLILATAIWKLRGNENSSDSAPSEQVGPPAPTSSEKAEPPASSEPVKPVAAASLDPKRSYAEQIEAENGCESTVYVSSLIGMAEFDKRYLSTFSRQESHQKLVNDLADVGEKIDDAYEAVRILQVRTSMDSNKDGLWDHRPMFTVNFPNLQNDDIKVSVYVDVPKEVQQYMSVTNVQPVSFGTGILLSKDTAKEKCDFNSEKNQFELPLDLHWNLDALRKLEVDLSISLNIRVLYEGDGTTDPFPVKITVKPAEQIEHGYPLAINFATLIDSGHPWIKKLINDIPRHKKWINNEIKLIGGGGGDHDDLSKVMSAYMVWEELVGRKMSYQSFTGGDFQSQRARRVHETLETSNGNCADGSILFASFFEAIGLNTFLVIPRGHMYVAIVLEKSLFPIETTDIGRIVSQEEYKNISLHPLLGKMVQRFKWLEKDAAFRSFALAVFHGEDVILKAVTDLERLDKKLKNLHDGPERDQVLDEIENGIQLQSLKSLRSLGIQPVGTPQDWAQAHRLPLRVTSP